MFGACILGIALAGPHADQVAQFGQTAASVSDQRQPAALPPPTPGPDMTVYGYLAYWNDDLASVPWDDLTHLAVFAAEATPTGGLLDTGRWDIAADAVAMGAPYGVEVHLVVLNFNPTELGILLEDEMARSQLVSQLSIWKASTGAHGINVDFEGVPGDRRYEMVDFVQELEAAVGDVVLATPSVDWSGAWDYATLTDHADLFIMGYGYHWSGASYAGPMDPLYAGSGTLWSGVNSYSLSWSADDYVSAGADPSRVILGLPLYGMRWPTVDNTVPSEALGTGSSVVFAEAWDEAAIHGSDYEPDSHALHTFDGTDQIWFGDVETVRERVVYARDDAGLAGIGFWALHYDGDDPALWDMIHEETTSVATGTTTDSGTPTTDTGTPTTGTTDTDTGSPSTGTTTDGTDPTDPTTTGTGGDAAPRAEAPPLEKGGCGCAAAPSVSGWSFARRR